jgi:AsmA family/AsmA-like C-terminal region
MIRLRKYGGIAVLLLAILLALQAGISLLTRTHRMKENLIVHLESAFGRPVQAGRFSVQILPIPELEVDNVTIGEDPAFGHEYFLRAEQMTAGFSWLGLLRGHIEFGTMSFTRPSLILVRDTEGRWNLERWLPPAAPAASRGSTSSGVSAAPRAEATYHLQKIDFDDGRINFKLGYEKRPFAFTNVSGSVEQVSPGRWELKLEAQPWRSGVALQSTGTLQVTGDVAGTSARLQPAQLRLHWGKVSLADLFRLATGNDSGVRGEFALDGNASAGIGRPAAETPANAWRFTLQARATNIHRWDLNERDDNPRINVNLKGRWELTAGEVLAEELRVELPHSNLVGTAEMKTPGSNQWQAQFKSMAVQGEDLLAWYRAFQPSVAEEVALSDLIQGSVVVRGWPWRWENGAIEGASGSLRLPGETVARLDPFRGTIHNGKIEINGFRIKLPAGGTSRTTADKADKNTGKGRANPVAENAIEAALTQDSSTHSGGVRLNLHLADTEPVFKLTAAFGYPLNKGWEYQGGASGVFALNWGSGLNDLRRNGSLELSSARLQVAGLNEPLQIEDARLEWKDGLRGTAIGKVDAFGAAWSGTISETAESIGVDEKNWHFQLHADHLDATELDRWVGPRSRPNWLQRLLPSLLGNADSLHASELLRRVSAEGELTADTLTVEKIKLARAQAKLSLHDLRLDVENGEAQWAGGTVRGEMQALFSPMPKYELHAELENVKMAQLPWPSRWAERWSGLASGKIHLTTMGVGKQELLNQLAGGGALKLAKVEFRGWDVELSTQSGGPSGASSRWTSGEGSFQLNDQKVTLDGFRLDAPHQRTQLSGTISFGMDGNLTFAPGPRAIPGSRTLAQARELRLSGHLENPAVAVLPVGAEQARP